MHIRKIRTKITILDIVLKIANVRVMLLKLKFLLALRILGSHSIKVQTFKSHNRIMYKRAYILQSLTFKSFENRYTIFLFFLFNNCVSPILEYLSSVLSPRF